MQQMQRTFNARMEPIQSHEEYPKYARSGTKPVARARQIIDRGAVSDSPCSTCVELGQECYRWEGAFSKCAYCTSKDRKKELCHLPGQEASSLLPERRKRRKITRNIYAPSGDAASTADTTMSGTFTFASIPPPSSYIPRSYPENLPIPAPTLAPTSAKLHTPPEASCSDATLERVTALENQVSGLETKVMDLLVKMDEVSSCCVSAGSTPAGAVAGASSPTTTTADVTVGDLHLSKVRPPLPAANMAKAARRATRVWVEGTELPPPMEIAIRDTVEEEAKGSPKLEQTVAHAER